MPNILWKSNPRGHVCATLPYVYGSSYDLVFWYEFRIRFVMLKPMSRIVLFKCGGVMYRLIGHTAIPNLKPQFFTTFAQTMRRSQPDINISKRRQILKMRVIFFISWMPIAANGPIS